ncbi:hypothetical protein [Streptomyces sp. V4I2]|uniref:hypothetical protein n=1 Tax=Streptomyces sp. V4I2 TaxID=3042280 RepID=UPI00278A54F0|nr:hypothetical protein [Streptomyces sp. V4I2]MDQ1044841.1 hypothetical protein [Streptomyces sp. V4I2]
MKGVFTRIRDRLARKRARPDTQGSSTDAVEPTAVSESSEIGASEPVANPRPTKASIVFVEALPADRPTDPTGPQTPAEVLPDRQLSVLDVVMYTLHTVMHSDSALKNLRGLVGWFALVFCGTTGFAASVLYVILHTIAPGSAPSFRVLAASVFGLGSLGTLVGAVWVRILRIRRRPKADPAVGDGTAPSATVTSGTEPVPRTPDAGPAPDSETGGQQP